MPSPIYEIEYHGDVTKIEYVFPRGVAASEGGAKKQFQELKLLENIRERNLCGVYIDGGAHVGNHTMFFAKYCPSTQVIAVEGHRDIHSCLRANVFVNGLMRKVQTVNAALWRVMKRGWMGKVVLNNAGRTQLGGDGRRFATKRDHAVACVTLDRLSEEIERVAVLKLDIEDCEVQAIQGARGLLERDRPLIIAEHHNEEYFAAFANQISDLGYKPSEEHFDPRGETVIWEPQ